MSRMSIPRPMPLVAALALGAALALPAIAHAQDARRRCPTCAPAREPAATPATGRAAPRGGMNARRGAPGVVVPLTEADITIGGVRYTGRVDAHCKVDPRATPRNTRAYYSVAYPWFGYRPPADQPQWHFNVEVRPGDGPAGASNEFVFSFGDADRKNGVIQTVSYAREKYGTGTVRVTRHGSGARFEVRGRTDRGETVQAIIDCSQFQDGEAAGG
ncbi:MAG TPA: hypothetical protein VFJ74_15395 [Gemmatimonadaceae bacterium]|nr:hypothetical protein [Gemmatimonadaceae bacterium]